MLIREFHATLILLLFQFLNNDLWKQRLNIDAQEFHQYQQNEQSPQLIGTKMWCCKID
jgi:hypothetical protein